MSLIFLKNDDASVDANVLDSNSNMKPYKWRNYFTSPIKIAPNSQVAFIKTQFEGSSVGDFNDATAYMTIGIPQLNAPVPLYLSDKDVSDFTKYVNNIGKEANLRGLDGDYNHIFFQSNQNPLGQAKLQDEFETGFNFIWKDDGKVAIRCDQRGVNDVFNQGFNSCGLVASPVPNGIETGTGDNTTLFKDNSFIVLQGTGINYPAQIYDTTQIGRQGISVGLIFQNPSPYYYNTNYAIGHNTQLAGVVQNPVVPIDALFPFNFSSATPEGGVFGIIASGTGIKKNVFLDGNPTASRTFPNGGGAQSHLSIAGNGSGGYANIQLGQMPQSRADVVYPPNLSPAQRTGFTGITPQSIGVMSADYMDLEFASNVSDSRASFRDVVDVNFADPAVQASPPTGNCDFTRAIGGYARYFFGFDIQEVGGTLFCIAKMLNPNPNGGSFEESRYIDCATLDLGELSAGYNTIAGQAFAGGAQGGDSIFSINCSSAPPAGRTGANLFFRFRWTSPYTMCIEFTLQANGVAGTYDDIRDTPYEPSGTNADPTTGWCMLYDMKNDPDVRPNYLLPSYMGDMRVVAYQSPVYRTLCGMNGYFDNRYSRFGGLRDTTGVNPSTSKLPFFYESRNVEGGTDGVGLPLVQDFTGGYTTPKLGNQKGLVVPEEFVATGTSAGYSKKQLHFLMNSVVSDATRDFMMTELAKPIFNIYNPPNLHLGSQLGLITQNSTAKDLITLNDDILGSGNPYVLYGYDGSNVLGTGNNDFTLHFQLTNFGIKSQQGVKSTEYKCIMVVNERELEEKDLGTYSAYNYTHPTPMWIDLNNYGEITTQFIDCLITNDENNEARNLRGLTNLVVAFRAKPKRDEGYVPNNIPVVNYVPNKMADGTPEPYYK